MPFCSSGSTQPIPGIADDVIITAAVISSLLPPQLLWIEPFIGAIAGIITIHLPTYCASDPPADPGLSAADILSLVALGPGPLTADAAARFSQLVLRFAWPSFCQCASVATPAVSPVPSAPTGLPSINPTGVVGVPAGPCLSESYSQNLPTGGSFDMVTGVVCDAVGHPTCASLRRPIPTGALSVQVSESNEAAGHRDTNSSHTWSAFLEFYDSGGTDLGAASFTHQDFGFFETINSGQHTDVFPIPSGATAYALTASTNTGGFAWTQNISADWFCSSGVTPVGGPGACCSGSDPLTTGQLTQILQMVTLIQRYLAPFAYQPGATHAALSGHAVITIPTLVGVLITLSTTPDNVGEEIGSPDVLWNAGWINWGNADGFTERVWISHSPQLCIPPHGSTFTRLGYTLRSGVVASIQELYAEA